MFSYFLSLDLSIRITAIISITEKAINSPVLSLFFNTLPSSRNNPIPLIVCT